MKEIGIRELKAHGSDIVRHVAEDRATYLITRRGHAVGLLTPADVRQPATPGSGEAAWNRLEVLANQLGATRRKRRSAVRELAAMRR